MKKIDEELSAQLDLKHYYDKVNNILNDKLVYISKLSAIMEEVKKQTGAENNNEILEKLQILLDDLKKWCYNGITKDIAHEWGNDEFFASMGSYEWAPLDFWIFRCFSAYDNSTNNLYHEWVQP